MEQILVVIGAILVPIVVGIVFWQMIKKRNEFIDIEREADLLSTLTGGAQFQNGMITSKFSYPFVQVRFYQTFLIISYYKKIQMSYSEIICIKLTYRGLQLIHNNKNFPEKIFLSVDQEKFLGLVREKGVKIEE
ncbi:hypothetical protein [Paenibacillus turpanensis]|uniref:hypothetical protein n=1 Tax=Paenibacillus turpanensis TaxID=2689078 RepID=UPI0014094311|nr:hypothetical protein [Paenibacillus turpanensis]